MIKGSVLNFFFWRRKSRPSRMPSCNACLAVHKW